MTTISSNLNRPRYFDRQQLRSDDLALEQVYQDTRARQLNQHLHGWGVVCGALVTEYQDLQVVLSEGFAISPSGKSIHIPYLTTVDLKALLADACGEMENDCRAAIIGSGEDEPTRDAFPLRVYLVAAARVKPGVPRTGVPQDCGHSGNTLEHSRLCDVVCLRLVCDLPPLHQLQPTDCDLLRRYFCGDPLSSKSAAVLNAVFPCPPALSETDDYVVLASLTINKQPETNRPVISNVQYAERRMLISVQVLQNYMSCLCSAATQPPTTAPTPTATPVPTTPAPTTAPPGTFTPTMTRPFTIPGGTVTPPFTIPSTVTTPFTIPGSTVTPSFTIPSTMTPAFTIPGGTITTPFTLPVGGLTVPVVVLTQPGGGRLRDEGIDVLRYDTVRGDNTSIDRMDILSDADRATLRGAGVNSVLDLYAADTSSVALSLGVSDIQVAEFKDNALESMKRAEALALSDDKFDVSKGMTTGVEAVHNVGPSRGRTLTAAGYASVADVANTQPAKLAKVLRVSEAAAEEMIVDAQVRMLK